jgi:hypothetical protein
MLNIKAFKIQIEIPPIKLNDVEVEVENEKKKIKLKIKFIYQQKAIERSNNLFKVYCHHATAVSFQSANE